MVNINALSVSFIQKQWSMASRNPWLRFKYFQQQFPSGTTRPTNTRNNQMAKGQHKETNYKIQGNMAPMDPAILLQQTLINLTHLKWKEMALNLILWWWLRHLKRKLINMEKCGNVNRRKSKPNHHLKQSYSCLSNDSTETDKACICVCVYVCVCLHRGRERERAREKEDGSQKEKRDTDTERKWHRNAERKTSELKCKVYCFMFLDTETDVVQPKSYGIHL